MQWKSVYEKAANSRRLDPSALSDRLLGRFNADSYCCAQRQQ